VSARAARRGFALVEVMMTLLVFTIGLLAMASYATTMSRQMRDGGGMVSASSLARTRFEQLSALPCQNLVAGTATATAGAVTETWTITPASRSVSITDQVTFPVGRRTQTQSYSTILPCALRP
jgi:prepilin-type N-terminal cleavage/methylation domain-containing protein